MLYSINPNQRGMPANTKEGALEEKYNWQREERVFREKMIDFESSIEVLKEIGSLYKMDQL